jgi:hypothetical protein
MRFKSFKLNNSGEKSNKEKGKIPEESVKLPDVSGMEEKINIKTKELKNAEKQIKGLSDAAKRIEGEEDEIPGPHGPLIELTVDPGDDLVDLDTEAELNNLMDVDEDNENEEQDIKVVEVGKKDTTEAAVKTKKKGQNEKSDEIKPENPPKNSNDDFNNLFSEQEDEVNPLANLINSLPEVSAQELINELEEIKEIIRERQQG